MDSFFNITPTYIYTLSSAVMEHTDPLFIDISGLPGSGPHDIISLKMATFKLLLHLGGRGSNLRVPNQVNILVEPLWRLAVEPEVADDRTRASVHFLRRR